MNNALINYYARLIKKKRFTLEEVPENKRDDVAAVLKGMPDIPFDPETQTPEEK